VNGLVATLNLVCMVVFVLVLKWSVLGALMALLVTNFTLSIISLRLIFRGFSFKIKLNGGVIRSLYRYGILIALSFFIMRLNYQADIIILQKLSTHAEIGFYSLGVNIAQLLWEIPAAVGLVIVTRSAHAEDESKLTGEVSKILRLSFIITLFVALAIYFLTPYVLPIIWGKKFIPSIEMTQAILPGIIVISLFQIVNSYFVGSGKPLYAVFVFTPALLINIGLNFLWIPEYGGIGAAMATNVSYVLGTIAMLIIYSKKSGSSLIEIFTYRRSDFDFVKKLWRRIRKKNDHTTPGSLPK
jgi:O-antigen/teichoic acid export membrane protein